MSLKAVRLTENDELIIIDQTRLPTALEYIRLEDKKDLLDAILKLKVRGAPAIGIAAAYGIYMLALSYVEMTDREMEKTLLEDCADIIATRPTAVNLAVCVQRMEKIITDRHSSNRVSLLSLLRREASSIDTDEAAISQSIARHAIPLLHGVSGVLTHCNAGSLATSELGTALAPLYLAHEKGMSFTTYCDETRPLLQGARLTAFELSQAGLDTVLICDNMAASLMAEGKIDLIFVGADRVAANGDTANKIGTLSVAVNAKHFGIPFYVCAPSSTIDPNTKDGKKIVIEQRPGHEITDMWYEKPMAPAGIKTLNPSFDVTPAELITGIIDEHGLHQWPYDFSCYGQ